MTGRAIARARWLALVVGVGLLAVAGCSPDKVDGSGPSTGGPASVPVTVTEAPPAAPTSDAPATAAQEPSPEATPLAALPMPGPGGGDMLWPTLSSATVSENGPTWRDRYGFVDARGRLSLPEEYVSYSYCLDGSNNPAALVVLRQDGAVQVVDLDGSVTRTIAGAAQPRNAVSCQSGAEVWVFKFDDGGIQRGEVYDFRTGRVLRSLDDYGYGGDCGTVEDHPTGPDLPTGYTRLFDEEWAADDRVTKAINLVTSAVVALGDAGWPEASGPYLSVPSTKSLTVVYDRQGKPTPFAAVRSLPASTFGLCDTTQLPGYYWARSGAVQGFVDDEGTWYYQEPVNRTLTDS